MSASLFVEIEGGVELCVPPSLQTITTYVALEQEDWFEDELAFVRRFLKPGMRVIDIGANYGAYALTMAKAVGPEGRVLCVEPASETTGYLRRAIERNGFTNIELRQCALSRAPGRQRLKFEASAELHQLAATDSGDGELVEVDTLDRIAEGFPDFTLDFLKLDAEGEELNILTGGAATLARQSPLILFERQHQKAINTPVIEALRAAGFAMYRFVPVLNILVPFDADRPDRYQLNLIACRSERAAQLAQAGLLCATMPQPAAPHSRAWARSFGRKPFFAPFATQAHLFGGDPASQQYRLGLNLYATAMNAAEPPALRWAVLRGALENLIGAASRAGSAMRLMSLARVAAEAGARGVAVQALGRLPVDPSAYGVRMVTEPFLPAGARFDDLEPKGDFPLWCATSVLEQYDRLRAFSSLYVKDKLLPAAEALRNGRYFSPAMERRRQLVRMHTGRQNGPEPSPLLAQRSSTHRNVAFWMQQGTTVNA
ncbi:MAG TPA: FkbM family methyltransferase [Alphaproteobacteria bacterium]|nr:FkbM family methyltransferase [Alphaproteobacteria bacterium]